MANLADVKRKAVKITLLDGVERNIRFTLNALAELENEYGSVDAAFAKLDKNSVVALRFILWAGLMHEDANLTVTQVGNLIDLEYMESLMSSLGEALSNDMPQSEQAKDAMEQLTDKGINDPNGQVPAVGRIIPMQMDGIGRS